MKQIYTYIALTICILCSTGTSSAQVTVGSNGKPVSAGILDIKSQSPDEENITSQNGGIVMPRLKLKNINTLEPFIANDDSDINNQKRAHIGLMVYNLTQNGDFMEGLYVWNGSKWDAVVTPTTASESITAENGLRTSLSGDYIQLGGSLDAHTSIIQSNNPMSFKTGTGSFSINNTDFIVKEGGTGIGKIPLSGNKLDVAGDTQINGNLTVTGETSLMSTQIQGVPLIYAPNTKRKKNKYLRALNDAGEASWQSIGGLSSPDMEIFPTNKLIFNPRTVSTTVYQNTGLSVELGPGKWLINYSVRIVAPVVTTANTGLIRPTTFRFTMLDEDGNPSPITAKKPYDDNRAYPDVYYNSCTGFMIVENNTLTDQTYSLGIRPEEVANWPNGDIEIANNNTKDAYIIALFLEENL